MLRHGQGDMNKQIKENIKTMVLSYLCILALRAKNAAFISQLSRLESSYCF